VGKTKRKPPSSHETVKAVWWMEWSLSWEGFLEKVLSLEWKTVGVTDGDSGGDWKADVRGMRRVRRRVIRMNWTE